MFNGMGDAWGMGSGGPFMILFWILVIVGGVILVTWLVNQSAAGKGARDASPLEILRQRYARGEINREEYEQKRRDLES
jgi:putative membrane protein